MKINALTRRQALHRAGTLGLAATTMLATEVFAAVFMEAEQAQRLLLPQAEAFAPVVLELDDLKLAAIAKQSDTHVPKNYAPKVWQAFAAGKSMGWVVIDKVIGKYDVIDYAVGFVQDGSVAGVEILAYRESHGSEVRQSAWRKQFVGRKGPQNMRFADDIRNISGATLSCQHVTEGIQRVSSLVSLLGPGR